MLTAEQVEDCIQECGDGISLEDIHLYYIYLTRLEPSEKTNQLMIKLQSLAANKYGEDKIPGFYRLPILGPPPPGNTVHPPNTNKNSIPITFDLELTSPTNQSTDVNMEQTQASSTNETEIHSIAHDSSNYETENDEDFQQVKNRKRKKTKTNVEETNKVEKPNNPNIKNNANPPIELKNRFNGLEIQTDKIIHPNIPPVSN
ncbi:hypothetical protein AVEN_176134-1 [Araneus ventricosus]|uniref:Uncharacterized protein n=1 Tax=Araneus ventricosus TaxID=182803 RepID=A0A4Y2UUP7_ARAVE|nr:hypothetical protein AVEN_18642-1 [Araneus ventricosus]GBO15932.1 hypothetical protein AVEN_176134-1 [Araneus ventricosus]